MRNERVDHCLQSTAFWALLHPPSLAVIDGSFGGSAEGREEADWSLITGD